METKLTNKLIVVAWHWDKAEQNALTDEWDCWTSADNTFFVRTSCAQSDAAGELLATLAKTLLVREGQALFLLHESTPHFFDDAFRKELVKKTGLLSSQVRVRLFGAGKGPIYLTNSEWGVLAIKGNFPVWREVSLPTGNIGREKSTFVIDRAAKTLNDLHLNYLWACYWNTPKQTLEHLADDFGWCMLGFEAQREHPPKNLREYLHMYPSIWYKLVHFAEIQALAGSQEWVDLCIEYRASHHALHLKAEHELLSKRIIELREYVEDLLADEKPTELTADIASIFHIHGTLTDVSRAIPGNIM